MADANVKAEHGEQEQVTLVRCLPVSTVVHTLLHLSYGPLIPDTAGIHEDDGHQQT